MTRSFGTASPGPTVRKGPVASFVMSLLSLSRSSVGVLGDDVSLVRGPAQLRGSALGHDRAVRHDRVDALVAGAQGRPRVPVALVGPKRHRTLREGGDRQRRVHPGV